MALHAGLRDNSVVKIIDIGSEDQFREEIKTHDLLIDISNLLVPPQVGWTLSGNQLVPPPSAVFDLKEYVKAKIKFYQESANELLRDMYATNTLLGITVAQSDEMFEEYSDVLRRIREGAWPTALYRLSQKQPSGFVTQEMIDNWIAMLQSRMS